MNETFYKQIKDDELSFLLEFVEDLKDLPSEYFKRKNRRRMMFALIYRSFRVEGKYIDFDLINERFPKVHLSRKELTMLPTRFEGLPFVIEQTFRDFVYGIMMRLEISDYYIRDAFNFGCNLVTKFPILLNENSSMKLGAGIVYYYMITRGWRFPELFDYPGFFLMTLTTIMSIYRKICEFDNS
jgi:hypothetical protein